MAAKQSLDPYRQIIANLLCDVQTLHSEVFTERDLRLTIQKIENRLSREGMGFLTKTLPRLGRALDRALTGEVSLNAASLRENAYPDSQLPKLFGELFKCIFSHDGRILPAPCVTSIKSLRQLLLAFAKLELPYEPELSQRVIDKFIETDRNLAGWNEKFASIEANLESGVLSPKEVRVVKGARKLLEELFCNFDVLDIHPRHGPGAVSTRETLSQKYVFTEISPRLLQTYPLDAYFYASLGHVCDALDWCTPITFRENYARVVLVPKDSRGPRLISCEPVDFQWIQQGLGRAIVQHVEAHPLTRYAVHFTDQNPNRFGAIQGSRHGGWATLDLSEASDRISVGLVRLLFPGHLSNALLNCRTLGTELPGGEVIKLNKFAPMGSALCFPVLALACWALCSAEARDAGCPGRHSHCNIYEGRTCKDSPCEDVLVYGDDVIIRTEKSANVIELLESFGLVINREKSCTTGFFRESCGMDSYKGVDVTPVRFRTVWSLSQSPDSYVSYVAYANAFHKKGFYSTYDSIVTELTRLYGRIPEVSMNLSCPSLVEVPRQYIPNRRRVNPNLQKLEYHVTDLRMPCITQEIDGWQMLLRYFAESTTQSPLVDMVHAFTDVNVREAIQRPPLRVSQYTKRDGSKLVKRWR